MCYSTFAYDAPLLFLPLLLLPLLLSFIAAKARRDVENEKAVIQVVLGK
jgi:hypothetical protein